MGVMSKLQKCIISNWEQCRGGEGRIFLLGQPAKEKSFCSNFNQHIGWVALSPPLYLCLPLILDAPISSQAGLMDLL